MSAEQEHITSASLFIMKSTLHAFTHSTYASRLQVELLLKSWIKCAFVVILTVLSRAAIIPGIEKYRGPGCIVITQMLHSYDIESYTWHSKLLWCTSLWVTVKYILYFITPHSETVSPTPQITKVSYIQCKYDQKDEASCFGFVDMSKAIRHEVFHFRV